MKTFRDSGSSLVRILRLLDRFKNVFRLVLGRFTLDNGFGELDRGRTERFVTLFQVADARGQIIAWLRLAFLALSTGFLSK